MTLSFIFVRDDYIMRYHYEKPTIYRSIYWNTYECDHPVYSKRTLYLSGKRGLAVIQQRYDPKTKTTWWGEIDPWLTDVLYLHEGFKNYFNEHSGECIDSLYPTVTIRQIMWTLKLKPILREQWETYFDRKYI